MGFRDLMDSIKYNGLGNIVKEFSDIVTEGGQELGEIMTDGFKEIVIKGNSDYKTSFEKKQMADSMVVEARQSVKWKAEEVTKIHADVESLVEEQVKLKKIIFRDFLLDFRDKIDKSEKIKHIISDNSCIFSTNQINRELHSMNMTGASSLIKGINISIGSMDLINQKARIEAANDYLDDAREFREKARLRVQELDSIQLRLEHVKTIILEEKNLLDDIVKNINTIKSRLEYYNRKIKISNQEQSDLNNLLQLANYLYTSSTYEVLTPSGRVSKNYCKYVEQLKNAISQAGLN